MTPAVNQVEYAFSLLRKLEYDSHDNFRLHPYLAQNELRDYCTRKGIALTAYTPSGKPIFLINNLASKYTDSSKSRIFPRPRPPTDRIPGREIQSHTHASHIRVAPFPEYYHPPHEQKFREAEGEYHGASYQPFESFSTEHIILDPYAGRGGSGQDLGIGSRAAALYRRRPIHWTSVWVDARTAWMGSLPTQGLVGNINGLSGIYIK